MHFFLLLVLSLIPSFAFASPPVNEYEIELSAQAMKLNLAEDLQWLRLGHYAKGTLWGYESQVTGKAFFLSEDGKTDPESELLATIQGLFATQERDYESLYPTAQGPTDKQFPRCQFPARYIYLKEKLQIDESRLPKANCERFDAFKKRIAAKSASLIFSSYYLNNPSSAFGHSLLRLNRKPHSGSESKAGELLDWGINFAAEVDTANALSYAFKGAAGGFRGTFSNIPYYFKVREYNDFESRDLWSYDLNLTEPELEMLLAHLWEVGSSYFNYYYFSQNCSFQLLTVLDAAAPRLNLSDPLPPYVIPADTIRQVASVPGLVGGVHYRPSARSMFYARLEKLNDSERKGLQGLVQSGDQPTPLPPEMPEDSKIRALDTALDYMDFRFAKELVKKEDNESSRLKQRLLQTRADIQQRSETFHPEIRDSDRPDLGHPSARAGLEGGYESGLGAYSQIQMRFALHDLLDPNDGYPSSAQLEFMNLKGRFQFQNPRAEIEELTLFRITSLSPLETFNKQKSWRVEMGAKRIRDRNCDRCLAGNFELGGGTAIAPVSWMTIFGLGEGELSGSPGFMASKARIGFGPSLGVLMGKSAIRALIKGGYRYQLFSAEPHTYQASTELRWNFNNRVATSVKGSIFPTSSEGSLAMYFYF